MRIMRMETKHWSRGLPDENCKLTQIVLSNKREQRSQGFGFLSLFSQPKRGFELLFIGNEKKSQAAGVRSFEDFFNIASPQWDQSPN